jgi:pilus assembly protein CpaF
MLEFELTLATGSAFTKTVGATKCVIGRAENSDLVLEGWKVHKQHAEVFVSNGQVFIRNIGNMFGTFVHDKKISTFGPLKAVDVIKIGDYLIRAKWVSRSDMIANADASTGPSFNGDLNDDVGKLNSPQLDKLLPKVQTREKKVIEVQTTMMGAQGSHDSVKTELRSVSVTIDREWLGYRRIIHDKLLDAFDMRRTDVHKMADDELRRQTETAILEIFKAMPKEIPANVNRERLLEEVRDEAIGLGLLEPLLKDPSTSEIMVNRSDEIFVERDGKLMRVPHAFSSDKAMMGVIERIVAPVGRRIDESSPLVDARLKDGSRFNAIIPPLALKGPSMTIRKFAKRKLEASDLIRFNSANHEMVEFLQTCVVQRKNMIVSGGTGSGKTTLLNILSNFIPEGERIVTIEDAAELQLHHEHLVSLESRPPNSEGKGQVAIRDLVKNSLRMRPDRIVVGECRGGEALDMLQAMNTGHDGSLTTAHANTPRDMLARLEVMVLMSGMDLPITAIREQVASAVDVIVQQTRFACGTRKITKVTEVTGVESGKVQLQDIFEFIETGYSSEGKTQGYFTGCDAVPEFYEKLSLIGVPVNLEIFKKVAP